ncbi:MAG TPA: hypothetical protein VLD18_04370 [Verrucomicrobiae bacterium]|nr:hypothetical protein [Verrucomicrobiae bacterium]
MKQNDPIRSAALTAAILAALTTTGCKEEGIRVYQVPKEQAHVHAQSAPAGASRPPGMPTAHVHWDALPANWQDRPVSGVMRAAEFQVTGTGGQQAELAVIPLPALAGKELEFVNMWREQINLQPTTTADVAELREDVTIGGLPGQLFDMVSEEPIGPGEAKQRVMVAMMTDTETTWFFKLTGPDELVAAEKTNLKSFLETVELHSEPHDDPHAGLATTPPPATTPSGNVPRWTVPTGWTSVTPGSMLLASFDLPGGGAKVTVSSLSGDGGGLLPNVNRWRGQIGLGPISTGELASVTTEVDLPGGKATLVDLANDEQRMLTLIVPRQGQSWFYKSMGDFATVAREKDALLQFARSAQY